MRGTALAAAVLASAALAGAAAAGEGYALLEGHGGPVKGVAVSADGTRALTASFDTSVGVWALPEGRHLGWLEGHEAAANAVAFLPGGRAVSAGDDFDLILWDLATGEALHRFEGHRGKVISVSPSPDGSRVASAGWDGVVGVWSVAAPETPPVWLEGHDANVNDAAWSADGGTLYTASYDGTIRRWDLADGAETVMVSHGFGVNHLAVDEAAGWLAYGALDGAVRALDLATGGQIADLTADRRPILALARDPATGRLAVGDGEGYIMVIDTSDWSILRDFRAALAGPIWALAWEPGTGRLLAGGIADDAGLWPVEGGEGAIFAEGERPFHKDPAEMTNGERQFVRKCSICHTLAADGGRKAGPSLWGVFGRRAGTVEGYVYSDALEESGIVWSEQTIGALFELGPDVVTPGSKMPVQRITADGDRRDLIGYLRQNTGPGTAVGQQGTTQQ